MEQAPPKVAWWRRALRVSVAAVMASWGCVQFWVVHTEGLSRWRGGGFGMYSEFHPSQNDAWLFVGDEPPVHFSKFESSDHPFYASVRPHLTFPRAELLQTATDEFARQQRRSVRVVVTAPEFEIDSGVLFRREVLVCESSGADQ